MKKTRGLAATLALLSLAVAGAAAAAPRLRAIAERDASGDLFKEFARQKKQTGIVPSLARAMSLDASLLRAQTDYGESLLATQRHLTPLAKHMIGLTVARAQGSECLAAAERAALRRLGLEAEKIQRLEQDPRSAGLDDRDVAALEFSRKVAQAPRETNEQSFADLQWEGLTEEESLETVVVAAWFDYLARVGAVLGAEADVYPEP